MISTSLRLSRISQRRHPTPVQTPRVTPKLPHLALSPSASAPSYSHLFQLRTRFIVHSLSSGAHIPSILLSKLLQHRNIPAERLFLWVDALRVKDPIRALHKLGLLDSGKSFDELHRFDDARAGQGKRKRIMGMEEREERERVKELVPDWLVLAIPGLATTHQHAPYLAGMLLSNRFSILQKPNQALLLARCIQHFIKIKHYVAVLEAVTWALQNDHPSSDFMIDSQAFARCLAALASSRENPNSHNAPPTHLLRRCAEMLVDTMEKRGIKKTKAVVWPLFSRTLIPKEPRKAVGLLKEVLELGLEANVELLHAVMRVLAASGDSKGAKVLRTEIESKRGRLNEFGMEPSRETEEDVEEGEVEKEGDVEKEGGAMGVEGWGSPKIADRITEDGREKEDEQDDLLDHLPSHGAYDTTYLSSLSADPRQAIEVFDYMRASLERDPTSLSPTSSSLPTASLDTPPTSPPLPSTPLPSLDKISKMTFLKLLSKSSANLTASRILSLVATIENPSRPRKNLTLYTCAISALNNRGNYSEAMDLWKRIEKEGNVRPDTILLGALASVYCNDRKMDEARGLLRKYAHRKGVDPDLPSHNNPFRGLHAPLSSTTTETQSEETSPPPPPHRVKIDTTIINIFLSSLNRSGQHLAVWSLFNDMKTEWDVLPDNASISILLDSARYASAFAGKGYGPGAQGIELDRGTYGGRLPSDDWGGTEAWRRGDEIMKRVLEGNWPHARKRLAEPMGPSGQLSWWKRSSTTTASDDDIFKLTPLEHRPPPFESTLSIEPPLFPQIFPNQTVFRSLIKLLGFHSNYKALVEVLAWMRFLDCIPDRPTLLLAVMYIDEHNPPEKGRLLLRSWLVDWLGEKMAPKDFEIAHLRSGRIYKRHQTHV